jgi:hypothetical protein
VIKFVIPAGISNVAAKQASLSSKSLEMYQCVNQGRGPENYGNEKFVTHFW